jgi:hypothetical protein
MENTIASIDKLPKIVKILLALPGLDIFWGIYRIMKGVAEKNNTVLVAGICWLLLGWGILWIIDIFSLICKGNLILAGK